MISYKIIIGAVIAAQFQNAIVGSWWTGVIGLANTFCIYLL